MNNKFFELKKEKQDKMMNAALKIFALNHYKHASTDEIVKEAEISKGLLFHYFTNKLNLFSFLYDYSIKYISMELYRTVSIKETNYFELLKQVEKAHFEAMKQYPYMVQFLDTADREIELEVVKEIEEKKAERKEFYEGLLQQIDSNQWKEGIEEQLAIKTVKYTLNGMKQEHFKNGDPMPKILHEQINNYLSMFEYVMYKTDPILLNEME